MEAQERAAGRLRNALDAVDGPAGGPPLDPQPYRDRFVEAMDDDLNTPRALAALFDAARDINRGREGGQDVRDAQEVLRELSGVLGLTLREPGPAGSADIAPLRAAPGGYSPGAAKRAQVRPGGRHQGQAGRPGHSRGGHSPGQRMAPHTQVTRARGPLSR